MWRALHCSSVYPVSLWKISPHSFVLKLYFVVNTDNIFHTLLKTLHCFLVSWISVSIEVYFDFFHFVSTLELDIPGSPSINFPLDTNS